jgi:diguanylate cyclase (GGDEF)-like protein
LGVAALVCAIVGVPCLVVLFRSRSRAATRFGVGITVTVAGTVVAAVAPAVATEALAAGYATGALVLALGMLVLPGVAADKGVRRRRLLDGVILGSCLIFAAWALLIEPWHQERLHGPVNIAFSLGTLAVAAPAGAGVAAVGVAAVCAFKARRPRRSAWLAAAGVLLTVLGQHGLVVAGFMTRHTGEAGARAHEVAGASMGAAFVTAGCVALAGAGRAATRFTSTEAWPATAWLGGSVLPAFVPVLSALGRLVFIGPLDNITTVIGVSIVVMLAVQQGVARHDLRRYAARLAAGEAHFRVIAHTDPLTGLANRRQLLADLHHRAFTGRPCVLVAIDLDGFKNVNDTRGHDVGDAVLLEVARRLRGSLREDDLAARLGGDEFALLVSATPDAATRVCDGLLAGLARPYELRAGTVFLSASIGMASCASADSVPALLRNADLALRFAKQRGKNRVERYDEEYGLWLHRRTELAQELRGAVGRGELMLAYQPVVALPERRVAGVEALLRWHHPQLGQVPPDEFIPVAEEAGLIQELGGFALREGCAQLARWLGDGHDIWLAVNVSVQELADPEYAGRVADALAAHGAPADRLVVEVTEHEVALDIDQLVSRLTALRHTGVRVALDDFGSGYSSLGQLRTLPVDILKIDRSILAPPASARATPLIDVVVRLGNRLGLEVVAEGVADEYQARVLADAGCGYAQGLLFGRSMPAEHVEATFSRIQMLGSVDSAREIRQS